MKCENRPIIIKAITSPPVWGAWIEIKYSTEPEIERRVAPRMGGVD